MIETEVRDGVGILTLNRPQARNALTPELQFALVERFDGLAANPEVGAIILTGAGEAFCAGGDVKAMSLPQSDRIDQQIADLRAREDIVLRVRSARQVVIAQIRGPATGAGLAMALACDIRICSPSARFGAAYVNVGLTGDFGISWLLQAEVGASRARQMLLSGKMVSSEEACAYGIVHQVVEEERLAETAFAEAKRYADGPRVAYGMIKLNLLESSGALLAETLDHEAQRLVLAKQTKDHKQAVAAFAAKGRPVFRGE